MNGFDEEMNFSQFPDNNFGWAGADREVLERALSEAPPELVQPLQIYGDKPPLDHMMLWKLTRKALGKDTENYRQQTGCCVSMGMKNAIEYLECCQLILGNLGEFHPIFPPYIYGISRMIGNMMDGGAGSVGVYACQAVTKYGTIRSDQEGVPEYSGRVADEWGRNKEAFEPFVNFGKEHLVKHSAKISNWEESVSAITNLYTVTVASDVGYSMTCSRDGFNHREGSWNHQLCCIGIDNGNENIEPHACILNSWGDVHGRIKDFRDPSLEWPMGTIRVRKRDFEAQLAAGDSWAVSSFSDFRPQEIDFSQL